MALSELIQQYIAEYVEKRLRLAGIGDTSIGGGNIVGPIPGGSLPAHALVGASHTATGLTTGHVLTATSATAFAFQAAAGGGGDLITAADYGVVGDGTTNDTAALQAWLDAVQADGGVGLLPPAVYRVATGLTWTALKKAKLLCYGATLLPDNAVIALLIDQDDSGGTVFPLEVAGLMVDGGAKADGCIGIEIADSDYITLRDVRVVNCGVGIRLTVDDTWVEGTLFENVYVKFCTTGVYFRTLTGSPFSSFGETVFQNVGVATCDTGVRVDQNCYLYRSQWNLILWADGNSQKCLSIAGDVYGSHWYVGLERLSGTSTVGIEVTSTALNTDLFTLILTWNGAFATRLSVHASKTLRYREGNVWRVAGVVSGVVQQWMTDADTQPRVQFGTTFPGGGGLEFGPGSTTAMDVNLYRAAANSLVTDDALGLAQFSTAGRPAATAVRAGSMIWNTTTLTVQRSDGTVWTDVGSGMTNPMTTLGDIIAGGASGAPGRLGVGTNGDVLTVVSGAPAWDTPGGGATITVQEVDGTPTVASVDTLIVSNGSLTDNADGSVTLVTGGGGGSGNYVLIDDEALAADAASWTSVTIGSTYKHLVLIWSAKCDTTAGPVVGLRFNGDTAANYDAQIQETSNTSITAFQAIGGTSIRVGLVPSSAVTDVWNGGRIEVIDIQAARQKAVMSRHARKDGTSSGNIRIEMATGFWRGTGAITSVTLFPASNNFESGSRFTLYGLTV